MSEPTINPGQMRRLQVLYAQLCAHTQQSKSRDARLAWAAQACRRPIQSFHELTRDEARRLIDAVQRQLGVEETSPRKRMDRRAAQRAGTEGRAGDRGASTMVSTADIARIEHALAVLGWTEERLAGWLRSPRSPLRGRPQIRTLGDANRVWWALKHMAMARGLWKEKEPA